MTAGRGCSRASSSAPVSSAAVAASHVAQPIDRAFAAKSTSTWNSLPNPVTTAPRCNPWIDW
jgi:hypothetical protein